MSLNQRSIAHRSNRVRLGIEHLEHRELLSISRGFVGDWNLQDRSHVESHAETQIHGREHLETREVLAPASFNAVRTVADFDDFRPTPGFKDSEDALELHDNDRFHDQSQEFIHYDLPFQSASRPSQGILLVNWPTPEIVVPLRIVQISLVTAAPQGASLVASNLNLPLSVASLGSPPVARPAVAGSDRTPWQPADSLLANNAAAASSSVSPTPQIRVNSEAVAAQHPASEREAIIASALARSAIPRTPLDLPTNKLQTLELHPFLAWERVTEIEEGKLLDHPDGGLIDLRRYDDLRNVPLRQEDSTAGDLHKPLAEDFTEDDSTVLLPGDESLSYDDLQVEETPKALADGTESLDGSYQLTEAEQLALCESGEGGLIDLAHDVAETIAMGQSHQLPQMHFDAWAQNQSSLATASADSVFIEASLGVFRAFEIAGPAGELAAWIDVNEQRRNAHSADASTTASTFAATEPSPAMLSELDGKSWYLRGISLVVPAAVFAASWVSARRRQSAKIRPSSSRIDPNLCDLLFARQAALPLDT